MIFHPQIGQRVQAWYRAAARPFHLMHGQIGVVRIVGKGLGPRNIGVDFGGILRIIPRGNLRTPRGLER